MSPRFPYFLRKYPATVTFLLLLWAIMGALLFGADDPDGHLATAGLFTLAVLVLFAMIETYRDKW
jgi:hypothetical protein